MSGQFSVDAVLSEISTSERLLTPSSIYYMCSTTTWFFSDGEEYKLNFNFGGGGGNSKITQVFYLKTKKNVILHVKNWIPSSSKISGGRNLFQGKILSSCLTEKFLSLHKIMHLVCHPLLQKDDGVHNLGRI